MKNQVKIQQCPDENGYYGEYGGCFVPKELEQELLKIRDAYYLLKNDNNFQEELNSLYKNYVGRPSPIFYAENLTKKIGGAKIFLKREDLNHTGAHKINHTLGEALLAKKMGKKKLIAETGAGQHGVALATAAALTGLECDIYMGEVDIEKEKPNVLKMQILGAKVIPATKGHKTLKEAVDLAFEEYLKDPETQFYAIGSVVGPHPFPQMVRDFQSIVGKEARAQFLEMTNKLPDSVVACVGGGSNSIGIFSGFLEDEDVKLYGVEPAGKSFEYGQHAATLTFGEKNIIHGFKCYCLTSGDNQPAEVYSVASGLDYPGVGPEHCYLKDLKRVNYEYATDEESIDAFFQLSRTEGIIPALESSHAIAYAIKLAKRLTPEDTILVNLSGRGDKDADFVIENYGEKYGITK